MMNDKMKSQLEKKILDNYNMMSYLTDLKERADEHLKKSSLYAIDFKFIEKIDDIPVDTGIKMFNNFISFEITSKILMHDCDSHQADTIRLYNCCFHNNREFTGCNFAMYILAFHRINYLLRNLKFDKFSGTFKLPNDSDFKRRKALEQFCFKNSNVVSIGNEECCVCYEHTTTKTHLRRRISIWP